MPKAHQVEIAGQQFAGKTMARAYMSAMLNRYRPGETLNAEDTKFLAEAIKRHPDAKDKIGTGHARFEVRSAEYGKQCFWIIRSDGSEERFSYKYCV